MPSRISGESKFNFIDLFAGAGGCLKDLFKQVLILLLMLKWIRLQLNTGHKKFLLLFKAN